MRSLHFAALTFALSFLFFSCKKSSLEHNNSFKKSETAWQKFKAENNNSYRFVTQSGSWTGQSSETSIKVENGIAVERKFYYTSFADVRMPNGGWDAQSMEEVLTALRKTSAEFENISGISLASYLQWTETGAAVGTHKDTPANNLLTLDHVYDKAKNEWLKRQGGVSTYFESKNNGMISSCGFAPEGCQDDCFHGISIKLIESL